LELQFGIIQIVRRCTDNDEKVERRVSYAIIFILEVIFIVIVLFINLVFVDPESIVYIDGKKMIEQTHTFMLSNWIQYYDYKTFFYRDTKVKIYKTYDDSLTEGDYISTTYFDDEGNVITREYNEKRRSNNSKE